MAISYIANASAAGTGSLTLPSAIVAGDYITLGASAVNGGGSVELLVTATTTPHNLLLMGVGA